MKPSSKLLAANMTSESLRGIMIAKMPSHVLWPDEATMTFRALKFSAINCRILHSLDDGLAKAFQLENSTTCLLMKT